MLKRIILLGLGCGLLLVSAGCCGFSRGPVFGHPWVGGCGPCGPVCGADTGPSCDGCGTCGPRRPVVRPRIVGQGCSECESAPGGQCESCGECGPGCGGGCGCWQPLWWFHPLRWVSRLFCCPTWCGPCCGERYWGEFYNDPPEFWDPCDSHGNWTGRSCSSCGHGGGVDAGVPMVGAGQPSGAVAAPVADPVMSGDVPADPEGQTAQPVQQPHKAMRTTRSYQYQR